MFQSLPRDILALIAEALYDRRRGLFSLKQLSLTDQNLCSICQPLIFRKALIPILAVDGRYSFQVLYFFAHRPDICCQVRNLVIPFGSRTDQICSNELNLFETLLKQAPNLKEVRIGGDPYAYTPISFPEVTLPCLLSVLSNSFRNSRPPRVALECYIRPVDGTSWYSQEQPLNLESITLCPFTWKKTLERSYPYPIQGDDVQAVRDVAQHFKEFINESSALRHLHLAMIDFTARYTPQQKPSLHHVPHSERVLDKFVEAIRDSEVDSLVLEGNWRFDALARSSWDTWNSCFNRLRSLTLSGPDTLFLLRCHLSPEIGVLENLEELRFSKTCFDHRFRFGFGHSTVCTRKLFSSPCFIMTDFLKAHRLRHLTLCGMSKEDLFTGATSSSTTLRSLRFHVEKNCSLDPLDADNIKFINTTWPNIEWLGIDFPAQSFTSEVAGSWNSSIEIQELLDALPEFKSLRELSAFIERHQGTAFEIYGFDIIKAFQLLRQRKIGLPLEKMTVTCINHVWKVEGLAPSRTLLRSFSRDRPEDGYTVQLWDTDKLLPVKTETVVQGLPPKYEFGLSKWEIEDDPLGTGEICRGFSVSCIGGDSMIRG